MNKIRAVVAVTLGAAVIGWHYEAQADDLDTNIARMQAMDKITGQVTEVDVPVGGIANYGSFSVLVRKCVTRSPEETPESTAFVDVVDNYASDNPVNIFKGWMFASSPSLSAVEHPIYDIWLLKCYNGKVDKAALLDAAQLAMRDELPMQRQKPVKVNVGDIADMTDAASDETTTEAAAEKALPANKEATLETSEDEIDFASEGEEDDNAVDESSANAEEPKFEADIVIGSQGGELTITETKPQTPISEETPDETTTE
ncbi:MAG: DUF2155 domain-containing protein [Alphaproteobacteria bacterium]|nr:DUF2155 domain-containing protein [Alphaproteobacteria bacterium]